MGIAMGTPEFKARPLLQQHNVDVFSSKYVLYGDISARVMAALEHVCPHVEQYSIDEAFLRLDGALVPNLEELAVVKCWDNLVPDHTCKATPFEAAIGKSS